MSEYSQTVKYLFTKRLTDDDIKILNTKLSELEGLESYDLSDEFILIDFMIFKQSEKSLKQYLVNLGFPVMCKKEKKPGIFKRWIDNLAKSNKESFGSKKLDCCELKD